jgi:hypothetical protein
MQPAGTALPDTGFGNTCVHADGLQQAATTSKIVRYTIPKGRKTPAATTKCQPPGSTTETAC